MKAEDRKRYKVKRTIGYGTYSDKELKQYLEAQAEISFKAGQEDVMLESKMGTITVSSLVNRGRRDVVEWIEGQGQETFRTGYYPSQEMWQDKLREWGIEL